MLRLSAISLTLACLVAPAGAETSVSLEAAPAQAPAIAPYRAAVLTVRHASGPGAQVIGAVAVRQLEGGPTILLPVTIPPGSSRQLTVPLPAVSSQQSYRVTLRGEGGDIEQFDLPVAWPVELLTTESWIDPQAYRPWEYDLPRWPPAMLRNVFIAAALSGLALAGALFIPVWAGRIVATALIVTAACVAVTVPLRSADVLVVRRVAFPAASTEQRPQALWVLTCRRHAEWRHDARRMHPVYFDARQMRADEAVIVPDGEIRVPLRPDEVRLFRQWR